MAVELCTYFTPMSRLSLSTPCNRRNYQRTGHCRPKLSVHLSCHRGIASPASQPRLETFLHWFSHKSTVPISMYAKYCVLLGYLATCTRVLINATQQNIHQPRALVQGIILYHTVSRHALNMLVSKQHTSHFLHQLHGREEPWPCIALHNHALHVYISLASPQLQQHVSRAHRWVKLDRYP